MGWEEIVGLRKRLFTEIAVQLPAGRVIAYETAGGQDSAKPWRTTGVLAEIAEKDSVVLELLSGASESECLLRVYRTSPLDFLTTVQLEHFVLEECEDAIPSFLAAAVGQELVDLEAVREHRLSLGPGSAVELALYPVPPPVMPEDWTPPDPALVEEVEQRFTRKILEILPEILVLDEFVGPEDGPWTLLGSLVQALNELGGDGASQDLVDRIVELDRWCSEQSRGTHDTTDIQTIWLIAFEEELFEHEYTRRLLPLVIDEEEIREDRDYFVHWVGEENYALALKHY